MKVREIMTTDVVTATPDTPFPELVDTLLKNDISGLPVVDDDRRLLGIVTEADLVVKEAFGGTRRRALEYLADLLAGGRPQWAVKGQGKNASDVMTKPSVTGFAGEDVRVIARRMAEDRVKRLPIIDSNGRLVGIVSRADVLRTMHRSDDELTDDVALLLGDVMRSPEEHDVVAQVTDGVVTLAGTVKHPMDLAVLTRLVWRLPAVVDVINSCTAREADPTLESYRTPPIG